MGRQDPLNMEANLGLQIIDFSRPKLASILEGSLAFKRRPSWPPFWRRLGGQDAPIDIFLSAQVGWGIPRVGFDRADFM